MTKGLRCHFFAHKVIFRQLVQFGFRQHDFSFQRFFILFIRSDLFFFLRYTLLVFLAAQLRPNLHQDLFKVIVAFKGFGIHAPKGIVPVIALHQFHGSGSEQFLFQFRVLAEFGPYNFLHDIQLNIFPILA